MPVRTIHARYAGKCGDCDGPIAVGDVILYGGRGRVAHKACSLDNVAAGPTTRERKAARAERLREWSDKRAVRAEAEFAKVDAIASMIPFGQPILVGHHSERRARRDQDRIHSGMGRAVESSRMAESMAARADGIDAAADRSIYSDDPDAIEQLEARIAGLEGERDRWKAFNAAVRKSKGQDVHLAFELLDASQRAEYLSTVKHCSAFLGKFGQAPSYHVSNLTGNIARNRKRLEWLRRESQG